ncbi:DUF86 domain-containing protein [Mucilaginibacter roseus]|uniref:DUF86 domain-containing protein n=1 Tax=Mucilaginibacter roseus TaxID=1528868 RepID=A0ABS8U452_9SPHI|nr:DUF86 domain-containing protein [Mucilaginibacter roseus]MCD8741889.1 DUF86 domain-containing protein [Mucilaginibacter roseus]
MSKRQPNLLLEDMLESANKILTYTRHLDYQDFINDSKTIDAVVRNFEIIGEAANRLPESFRDENPEIDWHKIRGLRNRIVHDYFGIDYSIIWTIKEEFLNRIIEQITELLNKYN